MHNAAEHFMQIKIDSFGFRCADKDNRGDASIYKLTSDEFENRVATAR